MADICDLADDHMERELPFAIAAARKPVGRPADGTCHNCGEHGMAPGVKYCDTDCRDDHARVMRAEAQRPQGE